MAITIDASSAAIDVEFKKVKPDAAIIKDPAGGTGHINTHLTNNYKPGNTGILGVVAGDAMTAKATVKVNVPAGEAGEMAKWHFGFIQFQEIRSLTLNWAGVYKENGEIQADCHLPASLPNQVGRDHGKGDPNSPFLRVGTEGNKVFVPAKGIVEVTMGDHPMMVAIAEKKNKQGYNCYIRKVFDHRVFHTIFAAKGPSGNFQYLAWFRWVVAWEFSFQWKSGSLVSATQLGLTTKDPGKVELGAPTKDKKVAAMLKDPMTAPKCGTDEQEAALRAGTKEGGTRVDNPTWIGEVPANFWVW